MSIEVAGSAMTPINRPPRRPRRSAGAVAAATLAVAITGCSVADTPFAFEGMPDTTPAPGSEWPRLADAPAQVPSEGAGSLAEQVARGAAIDASLADDVATLRARSAELRAGPVLGRDLTGDADRLRRRADAAFD